MGNWFSKLVDRVRGVKEVRLLMLGLDNAGKTTILYKLKFNQTVTTIPTAGFNVECLVHKNVKFHVWDVGGQDKIRPLWRHYHTGTKALIFVIDSQDRDRIHEARLELHRILTARELQEAILLVFANKQDLTNSMGVDEVKERLQLDRFPNRVWTVRASCATSGEGLIEGLSWLADCIKNPPHKRVMATTVRGTDSSIGGINGGERQSSPSPRPDLTSLPLSPSPVGLAVMEKPVTIVDRPSPTLNGESRPPENTSSSPMPISTTK